MTQTNISIGEYILSLTVLGALSGAVMVFAPDNGIKKYLRYLVSLIIALTLLMPLKNVIFALPRYLENMSGTYQSTDSDGVELPDSTEILVNCAAHKLRAELEYSVNKLFGINADILPVFDSTEPENITLERLMVTLHDQRAADAVKLYLQTQTGCEVTMTVGGEAIP